MNPPEGYTLKEILEIQFTAVREDIRVQLDGLRKAIESQELRTEKRFITLDSEIEGLRRQIGELREDNARYKTIIALVSTIGATVFAFLLNKIF